MARTLFVLFLLTAGGCGATRAVAEPAPDEVAVERHPDDVPLDDLRRSLEDLSPRERRALTQSVSRLQVNCPYTRASVQLPIAAHLVVQQIDTSHLDPSAREQWVSLQERLAAHVAVLDIMGVDLPHPGSEDHLHRVSLLDRASLTKLADPIAPTARLVEQNDALVAAMDEETQDLIRQHNHVVYGLMGPATMNYQNALWQDTLRDLAPSVNDPDSKRRIDAILEVVTMRETQGC